MSYWGRGSQQKTDEQLVQEAEAKANMKDMLITCNDMATRCFADCVVNFRTRKLDAKEELCVTRCIEKSTASTSRINRVMMEQTLLQEQQAQEAAK